MKAVDYAYDIYGKKCPELSGVKYCKMDIEYWHITCEWNKIQVARKLTWLGTWESNQKALWAFLGPQI